jgi:DNA topoisomerase-1
VTELKSAVKNAEMVWLASDEDREGEAIAWHLADELKLKPENRKRIVFHEITKNAILKAIENPRDIDQTWLTLNKREEFWTESLVSRCHRFFGKS